MHSVEAISAVVLFCGILGRGRTEGLLILSAFKSTFGFGFSDPGAPNSGPYFFATLSTLGCSLRFVVSEDSGGASIVQCNLNSMIRPD